MINNSFSKKYGLAPDSCQPGLLLLITGVRCVNGCIRGLQGKVVAGERDGWARVGIHRPPFIDRRALIREFNCQPYESEPVIDSTRTSLSLSGETAEWFARVAPASLQLPPSGMFSLSFSLTHSLSGYLSLSPFLTLVSAVHSHAPLSLSLALALFPLVLFLSVLQIKMHRGIFKLMHLSLFLRATGIRKVINLSMPFISRVGSLPFPPDQLLMALMVIESLKNSKLNFS